MYAQLTRLSYIYFAIGIFEVAAECLQWNGVIIILKPIIPLMILLMYRLTSKEQNTLFYLSVFFSFLTNIFFLPITFSLSIYALIAFTIHRIFLLIYILRILKIKNFIPVLIGFIPFICLFSYVFKFAGEVSTFMYVMIVLQNLMISLLGGIALSNYIMQENSKNSWLYMSGLLFVLLQFVIFIERYYIMILIFRPLAMLLNVCAFYCFYRFIMSTEKSNNNSSS